MSRVTEQKRIAHLSRHILVIDDEDYIADMLASALRLEGYAVDVAYNGRDGVERARLLRPSLMIIDIMMPYLSGPALIDLLRKEHHLRDVPVFLISAGAQPRSFSQNVMFIAKPFDLENVIDLVARHLGGAKGPN